MHLSEKRCIPCHGGVPPLKPADYEVLLSQLPGWQVQDVKRLMKSYRFENFKQAMDLAKQIADIAEKEKHHPDLLVHWGELKVEIWTHAIDALSENDFILAAKIEEVASSKNVD